MILSLYDVPIYGQPWFGTIIGTFLAAFLAYVGIFMTYAFNSFLKRKEMAVVLNQKYVEYNIAAVVYFSQLYKLYMRELQAKTNNNSKEIIAIKYERLASENTYKSIAYSKRREFITYAQSLKVFKNNQINDLISKLLIQISKKNSEYVKYTTALYDCNPSKISEGCHGYHNFEMNDIENTVHEIIELSSDHRIFLD